MTKIDYIDEILEINIDTSEDDWIELMFEKISITGSRNILESFHIGDRVRITLDTNE